jgi:predicted CoA-binding protein
MTRPLDAILSPRTIAVVGASRTPNTLGHQILSNLVKYGFTGTVFPVNPNAPSIHSIKAWPRVSDIPDPVDMAVICVPKSHVAAVAEDCGRKGVRGLVVISVDRHPEFIRGQLQYLGEKLPGIVDSLAFEIITEAEVAEHLEEGVMARRVADVFEVIMLAAGTHTTL